MIVREKADTVTLQIKPDSSVRNHRTIEIAKLIASFYQVPSERWCMENGRLIIAPPQRVSFRIVYKPGEISFYLDVPRNRLNAFQRRIDAIWERATVQMVDEMPELCAEHAASAEIHYRKHDIFSLRTDHRDNLPLASLLAPVRDLQEGDVAVFDTVIEPCSRLQWEHDAKQAHDMLKKGRMPIRRGSIDVMQKSFEWFNGAMNFLRYTALELTAFTKEQEAEIQRMKRQEQRDGLATRLHQELSDESRRKQSSEVLSVSMRAVVQSKDKQRRDQTISNICTAWRDLDADNEFTSRPVDALITLSAIKCQTHGSTRSIMRMSIDEVGKLIQIPGAELQEMYGEVVGVRRAEAKIESCFTDQTGIFVGTAVYRGEKHDVHIPTENTDTLMTARAFMGSPRQGKDQAIINLIVESKRKRGIGAIIPDWIDERKKDENGNWRGMANAVRDALPPEDVIDIDWSDFDHPVPFGLQSITRDIANARIASDRIAKELTTFLMGGDAENHMTREYLRDAAKACAGDLLDIRRLFIDAVFRKEKIEEMEYTGIGDAEMWRQFDEDMSDARRAQIFAPVNVRLGEIVNDEVLAPIFCQRPNPVADIRKWIEEGKVVILRIPTGSLSEMSVKILAYYSVMVPFLIKLSMNGMGRPMWIVINEPHQVETPEFVHFINRILAEGPKYQFAPLFAFHHLGQLSKSLADSLLSSSLSWHLFYNSNMQMYEKLKAQIEPYTPGMALKQTPRFHFIAASWRDASGLTQPAFMVHAPAPVKKRWSSFENGHLTAEHAQKYGKPIDEVLADIRQRTRIERQDKGDKRRQASA